METAGDIRDVDVLYQLFVWALGMLVGTVQEGQGGGAHEFPFPKAFAHVAIKVDRSHVKW